MIQPATLTRSIFDGSALPEPQPPHIQPQYYAALLVGEAIGSSGSAKGVELDIDDTRLSGYAFYERGTLKRAVLINSQAYLSTDTGARSSKHVSFSFNGSGQSPKTVTIKRLAIKHADDASGLTWGGQSFETTDAKPRGAVSTQIVNVDAGVDIAETEAVMLTFH